VFQYMSASQRSQRTLLSMVFFYALFNGSSFNLLNGLWLWGVTVLSWNDPFWIGVQGGVLIAVVLALVAFMVRRWQLTKTQANLPILTIMTLALVLWIVVLSAIAGRYLDLDARTYWAIFQWTWQIPAGFFVGTGLSWSIKDRQLSGVVAVDQRDVVNDPQPLDAHHHHAP